MHRHLTKFLLLTLTITIVVILGLGRSPALAVTPRHYTDLEFDLPPEIQIPEYTQFELANGLKVYLLEDHELPLVGGSVLVHTGDRFEPADKVGLASIVGAVMRTGGSQAHPGDRLNELLEQQAASIETYVDTVSGGGGFSSLSEDLEDVFGLFAEVLRQPAFPQDKIDFIKNQIRGGIARRNDNPETIGGREFQKLIYGADSPYARTTEYATVDTISRQDVVNFYQQYFAPNNMLLGIVGDFDSAQMRSLVEATLGDWQPNPHAVKAQDPANFPQVAQAKESGVFFVNQPQLTQSTVQMGHLSGKLDDPDYAALSVMNEVLNSFGGRLVNQVRSRQGLAYQVYAYWTAQFDYPGVFIGGGNTRSEATVPFIQSTLAELERIRTTPISEDELTRAKDAVLNSFIFSFATPNQTLSRVMRYQYFNYPQDFIFQYQKKVETTTAVDIQRAAQTHLKPENIVTLVVGNQEAIVPPLSTLVPDGKVTAIDITIPGQVGG